MADDKGATLGGQLGSMYKRWVLDPVVRSAFAVSRDFSQRPELYQDVVPDVAKRITDLQSRYGYDGDFPNDDQRVVLLMPIFGASDGFLQSDDSSSFAETRRNVIAAASDFSENAQPTGFPMLRERFRSALVPFTTFLRDRRGASLSETDRRLTSLFDLAEAILKDESVRVVFGINKSIARRWPMADVDPNGAKLIEKVTQQLSNVAGGPVSLDRFVRLQRVAQKGSDALAGVFQDGLEDDDAKLESVVAHFYAWGSDLASVRGITTVAKPRPAASATR
jgi:hypothetical protein